VREVRLILCAIVAVALLPASAARADMATLAAQYALRETGDYAGPLDGTEGPALDKAVQGFQRRNGLGASGLLDDRTLAILRLGRGPLTVGIGRSLRTIMKQAFTQSLMEPDWSTLTNLDAFRFSFADYGTTWSYVHVCGEARFPNGGFDPDRRVAFMLDILLQGDANTPPIAALLRGDAVFSDLWTEEYVFVEPFCALRVGSPVALGLVR